MFFATLLALSLFLFLFFHFLRYNEFRPGCYLNDPVLKLLQPIDCSSWIFILTYFFVLTGIALAIPHPLQIIKLIQSYTIMMLLRMCCLYLFPLEPPPGIIPLKDLFLESSFYAGRENLKDLFFSGHTATICLFVFVFEKKKQQLFFLTGTIFVAALILLQHVHYSIDVVVAPVVSFLAVKFQQKFLR